VDHTCSILAAENLGAAYTHFNHSPHDFIAVLEQDRLLGIVSRREVGMILGSRFGWELFGKKPVRDHLEPKCIIIREGSPIVEVLSSVFSAEDQFFFDDIVLVDRDENFVGLITVLTMIRLQHRFLLDNIDALEQKQQELNQKNKRNEEDLALARELQLALLPQTGSCDPAGTGNRNQPQFFYHYEPANTVGGDFYIVQQLTPDRWGVFLCDVMGHGVRSALVTTMVRALFEGLRAIASDPGELLAGINKDLVRIFRQADDGLFVTAIYMVVSAEGEIRYAKAGHHDPVLIDRGRQMASAVTSPHEPGGTPLGIFPDAVYKSTSLNVDAGSMIFLFTDGLFEIEDMNHIPIGYDNLLALFDRHCHEPPDNLSRAILYDISLYTGRSSFDDDICLVGIDFPNPSD
jgi:serine phosphatase RsbU (regulator of sigma subunit)